MMSKKILSRASLVCGASYAIIACLVAGCDRGASEQGGGLSSRAVDETKYKTELRQQVSEKEVLFSAQQVIIRKMEAVAAKYNGDLKAAAADPEMITLIQRARDIETNLSSNRAQTAQIIRTRAIKAVSEKEVNK